MESKPLKKTLTLIFLISIICSSEGIAQQSNTDGAYSERQRLLNKIKESNLSSTKAQNKEFISWGVKDPLKKQYYQSISKQLQKVGESRWTELEADLNHSGPIYLLVELSREGEVINVALPRPTEHDRLNKFLLNLVENANPFPSFPEAAFAETVDSAALTFMVTLRSKDNIQINSE